MQMMRMMLVCLVQLSAGAGANDACDARLLGATQGWGWCK